MTATKLRVKMGFGALTDAGAATVAGNVATGLPITFDLKTLVPPVDPADLNKAKDDLLAAIEAAAQGGPTQTADKNKKRKVVNGMLDKLAHFVQIHCNNDLKTLLSSGFTAVARGAKSQLAVPHVNRVKNGIAGQLIVQSHSVRNAASYEVRKATVPPDGQPATWVIVGSFTKARAMVISGLTAGTTYAFCVRAVGGSTGYSDWSDPVAHMCM
jgi:hypothetical protein